jgi:hypothetical protein
LPRVFCSRVNLWTLVLFVIALPPLTLTRFPISAASLVAVGLLVATAALLVAGMWRPGRRVWALRLGCALVFLCVWGIECKTFGEELALTGEGSAPSGPLILVVASLAVLGALVLSVRRLPDVARVSFNVGMGLWLVSIVWFLADQDRAPRALGHGVLWLVAGLPALAFALQGPRKGALPARSATDA